MYCQGYRVSGQKTPVSHICSLLGMISIDGKLMRGEFQCISEAPPAKRVASLHTFLDISRGSVAVFLTVSEPPDDFIRAVRSLRRYLLYRALFSRYSDQTECRRFFRFL